jgi:hypothetical protein
VKILCFFILFGLVAWPVFAAGCLPEAVSCSSPVDGYGTPRFAGNETESTLFQAGAFSLEGIDNGQGGRLGIRPSIKLGESGKLTIRASKSKRELRAGWTFD